MHGRLPSRVAQNYCKDHPRPVLYEEGRSVEFSCRIRILAEGGSCRTTAIEDRPTLIAEGARSVTVLIAIASNFRSWNVWPVPGDPGPMETCADAIERGMALGWEALLERHREEHRAVMGRMSLSLGPDGGTAEDLPIDRRVARYRDGNPDPGLEALMLRYGRYLLAASSRKAILPANLQGIWNPSVQPPWFCNYTLNVNTGMNYWMAETCALGDCHDALIGFALDLSKAGEGTALVNYGCRGSAAHHNSDMWRMSCAALGDASWSLWPMGLAILVRHAWERWIFRRDRTYLAEKAWPIIKGSALFILDWLQEEADGSLGTNPSTSPENKFLDAEGRTCAVASSSGMDLSLAREVLGIAIKAALELEASTLGAEGKEISEESYAALKRLRPLGIGKDGRILEWGQELKEAEPEHRHFSPLYALYPGRSVDAGDDALLEACKKSLAYRLERGSGSTGWSASWAACLSARSGDAKTAYALLRRVIEKFTLPNLLGTHPPFQIDANFGYCAAMAEMLLSYGDGWIRLLPALPSAWRRGEIRGMRAPGGIGMDISWEGGLLIRAVLRTDFDIDTGVEYDKGRVQISLKAGETLTLNAGLAIMDRGVG
jgi:alpha-L-fucosidase 2